jgi:ATP-dependent helicase YprA (DUF1998 family)
MNIFDLHTQVLTDYRDFVRSFLLIADERARQFVDDALEKEARLWPDFLVQVSPSYSAGSAVDQMARQAEITSDTSSVFERPDGRPFKLYRHQEQAIRKALAQESFWRAFGCRSRSRGWYAWKGGVRLHGGQV